uniref:hypothetical chloroplast RF19 n=1 Tax=Utricularia adpressa TaxID=192271 RepID=UPI00237C12DC|nr:hypothetical chloroplast RF19 [Utricularia adpressa]UWM94367.1 hypothetical chloroplast RF19 [Utricularia adpressa]
MREVCVFQFLNHFVLPSSMLARLVQISMFRYNNTILFVTSSFVGWLMGQILLMKCIEFILVWIRQNNSIQANKYLISVSKLNNWMAQFFSMFLFITCIYYLGKIPSPILTKKLKEIQKVEERFEKERAYQKKRETKQEKRGVGEEIGLNSKKEKFQKEKAIFDKSYLIHINKTLGNSQLKSFYKKKESFFPFFFEKVLVTLLFDSKRWNRPLRYIETNKLDRAPRTEMSQYFFAISESGGKEIICFTYPPIFAIFLQRLKSRLSWFTLQKYSFNQLYISWFYLNNNDEKLKIFDTSFTNRIKALQKEYTSTNVLERKPHLCNNNSSKKYFCKKHHPLLSGSYRREKSLWASIDPKRKTRNLIEKFGMNKIHRILLEDPYFQGFEDEKEEVLNKVLSNDIFDLLIFMKKFLTEPDSIHLNRKGGYLSSKSKGKQDSNFFSRIDEKGKSNIITKRKKKVPRRFYQLISELEQQAGDHREKVSLDYEIRSRKAKRVVILTTTKDDTDTNTSNTNTSDETNDVALIRYSQQSDFRRGIIKGSMRAQRRKIIIWELVQANASSPLFLDRIKKKPKFSFFIHSYRWIQQIFRDWMAGKAFKNGESIDIEHETNEKLRIEIAEAWDTIPFAQVIRGIMLLTQSFFRKYILFPSLILGKNIVRILLFQRPEWSEDFQEWNREMYVKCTYNGVPLSETEFPKNWLTDGIQIKIIFPFYLKPWHKYKLRSSKKMRIKNTKEKEDSCFLTIWGMESEFPFGSARKRPYFFKPIFKELEKKLQKEKTIQFLSFKKIFKSSEKQVISKKTNTNIILKTEKKKSSKNEKKQRKNTQLIELFYFFVQFFFEPIYTNILFYIIDISKTNIELIIQATKKSIHKSISDNQRKKEKIPEKKNKPISLMSTRKGIIENSKTYFHLFYDVSHISQAYVFYKISQLQAKNTYQVVHQYKGIHPFIKKNSLERQGITKVHWQLKKTTLPSYEITQWKKWLRALYQYDLSEIKRSGLVPKKRRNRVNDNSIIKKNKLINWDKDQLMPFKKELKIYSLKNEKEKFEKNTKYDLLIYKFLNFENEPFFSSSTFLGNKNQEITSNTPKERILELLNNRPIPQFWGRILYIPKSADVKIMDWKIFNFDFGQKADIETWLITNSNRKKTTLINTKNSTKIRKKEIFFLKLPEKNGKNSDKGLFDWMGMNAERINCDIGNRNSDLWFFSEFFFLSNIYIKKPWFIPSKFLLLNWNINEKNKVLLSSQKKFRKKAENAPKNQRGLAFFHSQQNDIEENYTRSEGKKIKQYKSKIEAELYLFLKRYWLFQLRGNGALTQRMISNIKVYCLLLKLMDPKKITLYSIQKRELGLDIMFLHKNLTLKELMKRGVFLIEPIHLSVKKDRKLIMYQTLNICLVQQSKYQTNPKHQEQRYVDKSLFSEIISPYKRITASRNKNFDFLIPETILSIRRCRILRILIFLNSKNRNDVERNTFVSNGNNVQNLTQVSPNNKNLDTEKNILKFVKGFLWPNYRLEDLACMNRYSFNTTNGSRLTMLRLRLYSQLNTQLETRRY